MHEDELKAPEIGEEDDALLPSGWQEGNDFFDTENWGDHTEPADGQTQETAEDTVTEEETGTDDAPTTGEEEGAEGQSAVEENEENPSGQTETTEEAPARILKLKVNHEDREINISEMSDDDLRAQLQKAAAFDALKDEQAKARYRQIVEDQISAGMTKEIAELVASSACEGKRFPLTEEPQPTHEEAPKREPTTAPATPTRDWNADVARLAQLRPDVKELPVEVHQAWLNGEDLVTAYLLHENRALRGSKAAVEKETKVLKQNAASAAKAPVRGVTGGGKTNTEPESDFLKGFDSDSW